MKVKYPGPGDTYHPQLGKLIADEPFDLADEVAKKYVDSGLLKEVKNKPAKSKTKNAVTGFSPAEIVKEVSNGQSTNR